MTEAMDNFNKTVDIYARSDYGAKEIKMLAEVLLHNALLAQAEVESDSEADNRMTEVEAWVTDVHIFQGEKYDIVTVELSVSRDTEWAKRLGLYERLSAAREEGEPLRFDLEALTTVKCAVCGIAGVYAPIRGEYVHTHPSHSLSITCGFHCSPTHPFVKDE